MFCLEADLRPDAANHPKKKSTDHTVPVADLGPEEKKEEKKSADHKVPVADLGPEEKKEEKKSTDEGEEEKEEKKENGTSALFTLLLYAVFGCLGKVNERIHLSTLFDFFCMILHAKPFIN